MPEGFDHDIARHLAEAAGERLPEVRAGDFVDAAAGDADSQRFLLEEFAARCPDDAVLSEEGADDPVRLAADRVWIVDPLDGTREFSELRPQRLGGARRLGAGGSSPQEPWPSPPRE